MFKEFLHFLTLSQAHNGPQVNITTNGFPFNNNNELINEAWSL